MPIVILVIVPAAAPPGDGDRPRRALRLLPHTPEGERVAAKVREALWSRYLEKQAS